MLVKQIIFGGVNMAERVSKEVPIAERITEFRQEVSRRNVSFIDGWGILQYSKEVPIVVYQCNEILCYADIQPEPRLNSFILSITVSECVGGKRFSVSSGKLVEESIDSDTIAYYEDPVGVRHHIIQYDICKFLLKKPKLVVSEEGVLVFYTEDEILATTDCQQYAWVRWDDFVKNCTAIEEIQAYQEFCKVTLLEGQDTFSFGKVIKKAPRHTLTLNFDLKAADHNMINPKFTKNS